VRVSIRGVNLLLPLIYWDLTSTISLDISRATLSDHHRFNKPHAQRPDLALDLHSSTGSAG